MKEGTTVELTVTPAPRLLTLEEIRNKDYSIPQPKEGDIVALISEPRDEERNLGQINSALIGVGRNRLAIKALRVGVFTASPFILISSCAEMYTVSAINDPLNFALKNGIFWTTVLGVWTANRWANRVAKQEALIENRLRELVNSSVSANSVPTPEITT